MNFLHYTWIIIKLIVSYVFCIFFSFATFCFCDLFLLTLVGYNLKFAELKLTHPASTIVFISINLFSLIVAYIVNVNFDKLINFKIDDFSNL